MADNEQEKTPATVGGSGVKQKPFTESVPESDQPVNIEEVRDIADAGKIAPPPATQREWLRRLIAQRAEMTYFGEDGDEEPRLVPVVAGRVLADVVQLEWLSVTTTWHTSPNSDGGFRRGTCLPNCFWD